MSAVLAAFLAASCFAAGGGIYVSEKKSLGTRHVFAVVGPDSARILEFVTVKGTPRKESERSLAKVDTSVFESRDRRLRLLNGDSAEILALPGGKRITMRSAKAAELNTIVNRAAYYPLRRSTVNALKGRLPFGTGVGPYYDSRAGRAGIPNAFDKDTAEFARILEAFNREILDSASDARRSTP